MNRSGVVVAAIAAVLGGLSGIALGSWLAWQAVEPTLPDEATTVGLAHTVLPEPFDERVTYYIHKTFWNPYSENTLHGGTGVRAGRAGVGGTVPAGTTFEQFAAAVRDKMRANGWRDVRLTVERYPPHTSPSAHAEVTGTRAGYLAAVEVTEGDAYNPTAAQLSVMWAEPPGHVRDTVLGGLAGALLGAGLGWFTANRVRGQERGRRRAYRILCVVALLMLAPACLGNIPTSTGSWLANTGRNGTGPAVYWGGFVIYGAEPLAILSLLPIVAAVVVACWPRPAPARAE
ncbi:hypothetical protein ACQP00_25960 [Dactylosporangium sp. CS-047395]|uniref:hypothetical protein n=1 Tax=Dactylosporangium sp. CS-047395 TaxID=3239936 RepID=UPI003D89BAFF